MLSYELVTCADHVGESDHNFWRSILLHTIMEVFLALISALRFKVLIVRSNRL
jgi:hypothetical protein